jgi:hypothetical protein
MKVTASKVTTGMVIMVNGTSAEVTGVMAEVEQFGRDGKRGQRVYYIDTTAGEVKVTSGKKVELAA